MFRIGVAVLVAAGVVALPGEALELSLQPAASGAPERASALPTTVSGRYVVAGGVDAVARARNTVYVGGSFSRIANRTGSAIVVSTATGSMEPVRAEVAGGSVRAAVADGHGGWYVGGSFTTVGGASRARLAHLLPDGTLDPTFAPEGFAEVRALALAENVLYAGGIAPGGGAALRAVDPATGAARAVTYAPPARAGGALALLPAGARLYAAFGNGGVLAYDAGGRQLWAWPVPVPESSDEGAGALALLGDKLLVGGDFDTGGRNLEVLDAATGARAAPTVMVPGGVVDIAVVRGRVYVARGASRGLDVVDIATGVHRLWAAVSPTALTAAGDTLYVAGRRSTDAFYSSHVYAARAGSSQPTLRTVSPALAREALALAPQDGRLLVGGVFAGAGGVVRTHLAAFDARTGALRAWSPRPNQPVQALTVWRGRVYVAGYFSRVSGFPRAQLAAVDARGRVLPWRPRLGHGSVWTMAVAKGRLFIGGSFLFPGQLKPGPRGRRYAFVRVAAFAARGVGRRVRFAPPVSSEVGALAVWRDQLLVAGWGSLMAVPAGGDGNPAIWRHHANAPIFTLATRGTTLYAGGRFSTVDAAARKNLAAFALARRGALLSWGPRLPIMAEALVPVGADLVFAGEDPRRRSQQALGALARDGTLLPWRVDGPPGDSMLWAGDTGARNASVRAAVPVPGGLFVAGGFDWLGPPGRQAAGGIGWLR